MKLSRTTLVLLMVIGLALPALASKGTMKLYGEKLDAAAAEVSLATLLKSPEQYAGKTVLVTGHVRQACTKKGCWMELSTKAGDKGQGARVRFKDYGFFVPLDSAGSAARLTGVPSLKTVTKEHVAHYEAEGGSFASKKPDGSAVEVQLMASGVELTR